MGGALAERDFVEKLEKAGFADVRVVERQPFGIDHIELAPLFTPELIELMRRLLPPEQHDRVATSVVVKARRP